MKIALDPYMHRHISLPEICRLAAEAGVRIRRAVSTPPLH